MNYIEYLEPKIAAPRPELISSAPNRLVNELAVAKSCNKSPDLGGPRFQFPTNAKCQDLFANKDSRTANLIQAAFSAHENKTCFKPIAE